jgi:uncharacterized membrane protein
LFIYIYIYIYIYFLINTVQSVLDLGLATRDRTGIMQQQLREYNDEEKLHLEVREQQKRLNTAALAYFHKVLLCDLHAVCVSPSK